MIEYIFVLVVNTSPMADWKYIGNFKSCTIAHKYMEKYVPLVGGRRESRCIHVDYMHLPKNLEFKYLDLT